MVILFEHKYNYIFYEGGGYVVPLQETFRGPKLHFLCFFPLKPVSREKLELCAGFKYNHNATLKIKKKINLLNVKM